MRNANIEEYVNGSTLPVLMSTAPVRRSAPWVWAEVCRAGWCRASRSASGESSPTAVLCVVLDDLSRDLIRGGFIIERRLGSLHTVAQPLLEILFCSF